MALPRRARSSPEHAGRRRGLARGVRHRRRLRLRRGRHRKARARGARGEGRSVNIRAHRTLAAGDAEAALTAWGALIAVYPTYLQATSCARTLGERGDHGAALAELDRFVERSPTDASGYLHRAQLYQARGDGERALANFRRATPLDRTSTEAHLGVATALAAKGDARAAARAFGRPPRRCSATPRATTCAGSCTSSPARTISPSPTTRPVWRCLRTSPTPSPGGGSADSG